MIQSEVGKQTQYQMQRPAGILHYEKVVSINSILMVKMDPTPDELARRRMTSAVWSRADLRWTRQRCWLIDGRARFLPLGNLGVYLC